MTMTPATPLTALVIGATGSLGREVAAALVRHGWRVRGLARDPAAAAAKAPTPGVEWVRGDAMSAADVVAAARGCAVIFQGANPPGYRDWARRQPAMLEAVIAAAAASGARIAFPGNVYNYGPDAWPLIGEDAAQRPRTRKGAIRVAQEARLAQAAEAEGVRSLIVRAGDFIGPTAGTSWLTEGWVAKGKPLRAVTLPGPAHIAHAWAYLPDLAETFARLIDREAELPAFARYHFGGYALTGDEMVAALERVAGRRLPRRALPWAAIAAVSPLLETFREMLEMRYLWRNEVLLDNARLTALLGQEPQTPLDRALKVTLEGQGCLEPRPARAA
jgi:nucleoside-diphosphate-sugar epimerase